MPRLKIYDNSLNDWRYVDTVTYATGSNISSSYANTASYALNIINPPTASLAITASYTISASHAINSDNSINSNTASFATRSLQADSASYISGNNVVGTVSSATSATNSTNATSAVSAQSANTALSASWVSSSAYIGNADTASYILGSKVDGVGC
jgi:hypothetical protein